MSWENFDPGEGVKIRLVYAHETPADIALQGHAVGTTDLLNQTQQERTKRQQNTLWTALGK